MQRGPEIVDARIAPAPLPAPLEQPEPIMTVGAVTLKPWSYDDIADLLVLDSDPLMAQWNPIGVADVASARAYVEVFMFGDSVWAWVARDTRSGQLLGSVALFDLDRANSRMQVGYWTVLVTRGKGHATTALCAASSYAFGHLGISRLELSHAVENRTSCRVAQKAGFTLEVTTRSSYRYGDGVLHDEHIHARLGSD